MAPIEGGLHLIEGVSEPWIALNCSAFGRARFTHFQVSIRPPAVHSLRCLNEATLIWAPGAGLFRPECPSPNSTA